MKHSVSLAPGDPLPDDLPAERALEVRDAVRRELQRFVRDLVSSLQFYQSQPRSLSIGRIVLTGGTARLRGLDRELERMTGVSTRLADPLARVGSADGVAASEDVSSLTVAIGLGIED